MAISLFLLLAACGGQTSQESTTSVAPETAPAMTPEPNEEAAMAALRRLRRLSPSTSKGTGATHWTTTNSSWRGFSARNPTPAKSATTSGCVPPPTPQAIPFRPRLLAHRPRDPAHGGCRRTRPARSFLSKHFCSGPVLDFARLTIRSHANSERGVQ